MQKGLCVVISGGEYCDLPKDIQKIDHLIACDRGWQYAQRMKLTPNLIVGDFDSSPVPETEIPVHRAPTRKDDTDTMLAVRHALALGYQDLLIACAFGGRLDHSFANLQTAAYAVSKGARVRLVGIDADAIAWTGGTEWVPRREGWSLSVFSLSQCCEGVTICGTKYECEDATLSNSFPIGVSNTWHADAAKIYVKKGILLILQAKLQAGEHI